MIKIYTGVDIENISRFENRTMENDKYFLHRIYTDKELEYCFKAKSPAKHLAARFCAKEAVYKAISNTVYKVSDFKNIEILNNENGSPYVLLKNISGNYNISISLSHDKDNCICYFI